MNSFEASGVNINIRAVSEEAIKHMIMKGNVSE